ncbi:TIGR03668 family PPOX class F420-dependent oxidoreductase [Rhodococcus tukisamuensis]|nr:TIGR03668 family PPOX class F420-dependent oxidoreductase [Rhodococcus tukisamuensis]
MHAEEQRRRFAAARVARMATVTAAGRPHLVPLVFATADGLVYSAVDDKPKSTRNLRRLDHITATGRASLLVDEYDEDWNLLWWVRVDCEARVADATSPEGTAGVRALVSKYPQYTTLPPTGPVIVFRPDRWAGWSATATRSGRAG